MRVAYISGPYTSESVYGLVLNIIGAARVAIKYWRKGCAVICPHMNTALFEGSVFEQYTGPLSTDNEHSIFLQGYLELVRRSDVIVMMSGWQESKGAVMEHEIAAELHKEIIYE